MPNNPRPTNVYQDIGNQVHQDPNTIPPPHPNAKKIIAYRGDRSACWFYRLHCPLAHLARNHVEDYRITVSGQIDLRQLDLFDMAIMQRQYKAEVFEPMLKMKKHGTKIVYEIDDDLFNVPKWNPAYHILGKRTVQDNIKHFLSKVDAVFVTNNYLKGVYSKYCNRVYVLPNSIDYEIISPPPKNAGKKTVCWQGSATHSRDVSVMRKSLKRLLEDDDVFVKLWHIELGLPKAYKVPFVPFEAFYSMFSQLDACVGLAPVTTVPFNRGKSNLKFLEYTVHDMATVASDFGPYAETIEHEKTGLLVSDNREWYDAIRYLIDHDDVRDEMINSAKEVVKEQYDVSKNYLKWKNVIDDLLGDK